MGFNCNIVLQDLDINCSKRNAGGIKKAILMLQEDLSITVDPTDETIVDWVETANEVVFSHNSKDATTVFTENKITTNGLGVVKTDITIQAPSVDRKINLLDYMSRREDIVCILLHNNDSVTISGWLDGLTMNYDSSSGTGVSEKSYVNIKLTTESAMSSLVCDDKSAFSNQTMFE